MATYFAIACGDYIIICSATRRIETIRMGTSERSEIGYEARLQHAGWKPVGAWGSRVTNAGIRPVITVMEG